jgi:hypothetical protein
VTTYQVVAPYITVPSASAAAAIAALWPSLIGWDKGVRPTEIDPMTGFYRGAILPADVPAASITFHLARGFIAAVP